MSRTYLRELASLIEWASWSQAQMQWLRDRLDDGSGTRPAAQPAAIWGQGPPIGSAQGTPPGPAVMSTRAASPASTGATLRTLGAVLLVIAAISFAAIAFGALDAYGRFAVLVLVGGSMLAGGLATAKRLPSSADALSIIGLFILTIAVALLTWQFDDDAASQAFVLAVSGAAAIAGSFGIRRRRVAPAQVSALIGVVLLLVAGHIARSAGFDDVSMLVWSASVFTVFGFVMVVFASADDDALWPPLAVASTLLGVALFVVNAGFEIEGSEYQAALAALVALLGSALLLAYAAIVPRCRQLFATTAVVPLVAAGLIAASTAVFVMESHPASVVAVVVVAMAVIGFTPVTHRLGVDHLVPTQVVVASAGFLVAIAVGVSASLVLDVWSVEAALLAVAGAAVVAAATRIAARSVPSIEPPVTSALATVVCATWAVASLVRVDDLDQTLDGQSLWAPTSALLIGLAAIFAVDLVVSRNPRELVVVSPLTLGAGLACVCMAINADRPDVISAALLAVACSAVVVALARGLATLESYDDNGWLAPIVGCLPALAWLLLPGGNVDETGTAGRFSVTLLGLAIVLAIDVAVIRKPIEEVFLVTAVATLGMLEGYVALSLGSGTGAPELLGITLAIPLALGGAAWVLIQPEDAADPPTMLTVAPALSALLAPVVWAVVVTNLLEEEYGSGDAWASARPGILVLVGAALIVLGARLGWAGVLFPATAAVAVVALVELVGVWHYLPSWVNFALAGALLLGVGVRWEAVQRSSRRFEDWARALH